MSESPSRTELALEDLRWLKALAARLVHDPHLADDAVQDTLVAALERSPRATSSLRAWLGAILRNVLRQEWRGRARRAHREAAAGSPRDERSTLEAVEELALHRRLVERVQELDEPYRTTVLLRYLRGLEVAEIARELGVPQKTVRTRLARAIEQLRVRMGSERDAWSLLLVPPVTPCLPPAIPALLLPMKLKAVVALVVCCLVGALIYLSASSPDRDRIEAGVQPKVVAEPAAGRSTLDAPLAAGQREVQPVPEPPRAAKPDAPSELRGFVRTLDGRGLAGVEVVFEAGKQGVFVESAGAPRTKTGGSGEFVMSCPDVAGRLALRAETYVGIVLPTLEGGVPLAPPILVAAPLRSFTGVVVDERREPVAGAAVEITFEGSFIQSRDVGGQAVHLLLPFVETKCDEHGAFRFDRAGYVEEAVLSASANGHVDAHIPLPIQSSYGLEITLVRKPTGPRTIVGRVVDTNEAPVSGAQVSLGGPSVESGADGGFRIDCEAWRKTGWIRAFRPGTLPAELALEGALAREHPIVLKLGGKPRSISGRVLDADGAPVAGASVWTPDTTPFGEIVLHEGENAFSGGTTVEALLSGNTDPWASQVSAKTDDDGRFVLAGLLDRSYALFTLDAWDPLESTCRHASLSIL